MTDTNEDKPNMLYRIVFVQHDKVYEVFAKYISEETLMGFIEIDELVFSDTAVVVDTAEEKLKSEFQNVRRSYIPMHTILRIDEVQKQGVAKIRDAAVDTATVSHISGAAFDPKKHYPSPDAES